MSLSKGNVSFKVYSHWYQAFNSSFPEDHSKILKIKKNCKNIATGKENIVGVNSEMSSEQSSSW